MLLAVLLTAALLDVTSSPTASESVSFQRDVLPILSDRCFACHGPDEDARQAELRLDERDGALRVVDELVRRIHADDESRMPPPGSGLALTTGEVELLASWVAAGAEWDEHWAFVAPRDVAVPAVKATPWPRGDLDSFVLARLEEEGLAPGEPATASELLRRVTLDLTGLPPTSSELEAFVADPSDAAYERVVDRLLASPRYGERMAWDWLDAARYADTDGYQNDPTRQMWPWRDWLVGALNSNTPLDQLTLELLAGDLLPGATPEQVLASAFNRNNAHNGEGGRIAEETRVENVFDRVETTATLWLGLTLGCARCHDHKYDPISQEEYYGLYDFFNQVSETGAGNNGRAAPTLRYRSPAELTRIQELEARVAAMRAERIAPDEQLDARQLEWEQHLATRLRAEPGLSQRTRMLAWSRTGVFPPPDGAAGRAFAHAYPPEQQLGRERIEGEPTPGWELHPEQRDGETVELSPSLGATYLRRELEAASQTTLELSLGSDDAIRVWLDGAEVLSNNVARGVAPDQERLTLELEPGRHELLIKIVNTGGRAGFYFRVREEALLGLARPVIDALLQERTERSAEAAGELRERFRSEHAPWWAERAEEIARAEASLSQLKDAAPVVLVMDQLPATRRRTTRLLERGSYDQPREEVSAGVPAFLPALPDDAPRDRLTLARWLVSGENPLTARVFVNRAWQQLLGRGLVATPEDFGRQGEPPSHPLLLDWLATSFVASGWDVKALHRKIVTSATYRQSARGSADAFREDPDNVLLARSARHRLPAWMLRDQALALSGLLVEQLGGAPVRPYQPEGIWSEATFGKINYKADQGDALYRRSLYVFWRRIVGPTVIFDGARRQECEVRPSRTNTPLHALVTLNEPVYLESARALAARVSRSAATAGAAGSQARDRVSAAFRAATARRPEQAELATLLHRHGEALAHFERHEDDARALLAVGSAPWEPSLEPADLAALTVVCSLILNLDEALTRP